MYDISDAGWAVIIIICTCIGFGVGALVSGVESQTYQLAEVQKCYSTFSKLQTPADTIAFTRNNPDCVKYFLFSEAK